MVSSLVRSCGDDDDSSIQKGIDHRHIMSQKRQLKHKYLLQVLLDSYRLVLNFLTIIKCLCVTIALYPNKYKIVTVFQQLFDIKYCNSNDSSDYANNISIFDCSSDRRAMIMKYDPNNSCHMISKYYKSNQNMWYYVALTFLRLLSCPVHFYFKVDCTIIDKSSWSIIQCIANYFKVV